MRPVPREAKAMTSALQFDELTTLNHVLRAAERERRDLLAEQLAFPQRIQQTIQTGDREQLVSLQQRQDELPQHIATAQVNVLQLQLRLLEIEHGATEETQRQLQQAASGTWEAYQAARKQWEQATQEQTVAEAHVQMIGRRLNQLKRQLERACSEADSGQRPRPGWRSHHHG